MTTAVPKQTNASADNGSSIQTVDWEDFRDHLATADRQGRRRWLYPKKPTGRWYRRRTYVSWLLLAVMFTGPFVRINGNPLLMLNIVERRFSIFGRLFWAQDSAIFAVALLLFITSIVLFTTAFGRLWCGWTCPQTLLMEMVFRRIEYAIEGDSADQRALNGAPWSRSKVTKKFIKHLIFFGLSFVLGNTLLSYIIGTEELFRIITDPPRQHIVGLSFMLGFTILFYSIFARFREQACTFICPYGRLQSTVVDENAMVVAYDYKRGEKRGQLHRGQTTDERRLTGLGDCVNCHQCVAVCPTGIDIRNGTQMECVNCTACIDACDTVMDKIARPRGLIRYASLNSIERGEKFRVNARMKLYAGVLVILTASLAFLVATRSDTETTLLRAPGALFQRLNDGKIENLYTLKIINKTSRGVSIKLRLENIRGVITLVGSEELIVPKAGLAQTSVLIAFETSVLTGARTPLKVGVYSNGKRLETLKTIFVGPRDDSPPSK